MANKKRKTKSQAKAQLDKIFSQYIRLRDSEDCYAPCCTCGRVFHWKKLHCGHFQSRRHIATRYEEDNCAAQCVGCNTYQQGQQYRFAKYINSKHYEGRANELEAQALSDLDYQVYELEQMTDYYKQKVKILLGNNHC